MTNPLPPEPHHEHWLSLAGFPKQEPTQQRKEAKPLWEPTEDDLEPNF